MVNLPREMIDRIIELAGPAVQARCLRLNLAYYESSSTDMYVRIPLFSLRGRCAFPTSTNATTRLSAQRTRQLDRVTRIDILLDADVEVGWKVPSIRPVLPNLRTIVYIVPRLESISDHLSGRPTVTEFVNGLGAESLFIHSRSESGWTSIPIPPSCRHLGVRMYDNHGSTPYKHGICDDGKSYASMYAAPTTTHAVCLGRGLFAYVRRLPQSIISFRFDHARCRLTYMLRLEETGLRERIRQHLNPFRHFLLSPIVMPVNHKAAIPTPHAFAPEEHPQPRDSSLGILHVYSVGRLYPAWTGLDAASAWRHWLEDDAQHKDPLEVRSTSGHPGSLAAWRESVFEGDESLEELRGW